MVFEIGLTTLICVWRLDFKHMKPNETEKNWCVLGGGPRISRDRHKGITNNDGQESCTFQKISIEPKTVRK